MRSNSYMFRWTVTFMGTPTIAVELKRDMWHHEVPADLTCTSWSASASAASSCRTTAATFSNLHGRMRNTQEVR